LLHPALCEELKSGTHEGTRAAGGGSNLSFEPLGGDFCPQVGACGGRDDARQVPQAQQGCRGALGCCAFEEGLQEDVDVVGLSSLGGTHLTHSREVIDRLREYGCEHIPVILGGTLPVEDIPALLDMGVKAVLRPGSSRDEIVTVISEHGRNARAAV